MKSERDKDYTELVFNLFAEILGRFSLSYVQETDAPIELCLRIPKQAGLEFEAILMLQNKDELWLCTDGFTMSMFPCYESDVYQGFRENTLNLFSGKARIVEYRLDGDGVYVSDLQELVDGEWKHVCGYQRGILGRIEAWLFPTRVSLTIVRNLANR